MEDNARTAIASLSGVFARYGVAIEVCTDNGPQFVSREFAVFARK